MTGQAPI